MTAEASRITRPLPERIERLLSDGYGPRDYHGELHAVAMAVVVAAVRCDFSCRGIQDLFTDQTELGRQAVAERGEALPGMVQAAYRTACTWEAEKVEAIATYMVAADAIGYGRSRTSRLCLLAMLWIWHSANRPCDGVGAPTVAASFRLLSEAIGSPVATVHRAVGTLQDLGFVASVQRTESRSGDTHRRTSRTSRWTLTPLAVLAARVHSSDNKIPTALRAPENVVIDVVHARETHHASSGVGLHAVWCGKALGSNGQRTYAALCAHGPSTIAQLASATRLHRNTLSRGHQGVLQKLQDCGLCDKTDGRWVALERDLDDVARDLGVENREAELRRKYALEREGFDGWHAVQQEAARSRTAALSALQKASHTASHVSMVLEREARSDEVLRTAGQRSENGSEASQTRRVAA